MIRRLHDILVHSGTFPLRTCIFTTCYDWPWNTFHLYSVQLLFFFLSSSRSKLDIHYTLVPPLFLLQSWSRNILKTSWTCRMRWSRSSICRSWPYHRQFPWESLQFEYRWSFYDKIIMYPVKHAWIYSTRTNRCWGSWDFPEPQFAASRSLGPFLPWRPRSLPGIEYFIHNNWFSKIKYSPWSRTELHIPLTNKYLHFLKIFD